MEHQFNVEIAKDHGVNEAIFIAHLKFWTITNLANARNIHDGYCWTYNTIEAFCLLFPYWTRNQIEHVIKKLINSGILKKGNYNATAYDRTNWYALTEMAYAYYPELRTVKFIDLLYKSTTKKDQQSPVDNLSPISEISEMDWINFRNRFCIFPEPIPDAIPVLKPSNKKLLYSKPKKSEERPFSDQSRKALRQLAKKLNLEAKH